MFIYQRSGWPEFRWDNGRVFAMLAEVRYRQGRWIGRMESMGFSLRNQAEQSYPSGKVHLVGFGIFDSC
jgi:hypothetical protein